MIRKYLLQYHQGWGTLVKQDQQRQIEHQRIHEQQRQHFQENTPQNHKEEREYEPKIYAADEQIPDKQTTGGRTQSNLKAKNQNRVTDRILLAINKNKSSPQVPGCQSVHRNTQKSQDSPDFYEELPDDNRENEKGHS